MQLINKYRTCPWKQGKIKLKTLNNSHKQIDKNKDLTKNTSKEIQNDIYNVNTWEQLTWKSNTVIWRRTRSLLHKHWNWSNRIRFGRKCAISGCIKWYFKITRCKQTSEEGQRRYWLKCDKNNKHWILAWIMWRRNITFYLMF